MRRNTFSHRPSRSQIATTVLVVFLFFCFDAIGQEQCYEKTSCDMKFQFYPECLEVQDGQYSYSFAVQCDMSEVSVSFVNIFEFISVTGKGLTTTDALMRLLDLEIGEVCGQKLFDLQELKIELALIGSGDNAVVVEGSATPSWCLDFDGKQLSVRSVEMNFALQNAPAMIRVLLEDEVTKGILDEKMTEMANAISFDVIDILGRSN